MCIQFWQFPTFSSTILFFFFDFLRVTQSFEIKRHENMKFSSIWMRENERNEVKKTLPFEKNVQIAFDGNV